MQWGNPTMLHALWLLVPLTLLLRAGIRYRERQLRRVMDPTVLDRILPAQRIRTQRRRLALLIGAVALGITALARPQWGEKWIEVRHMGLDIQVVLDTSNSMRSEDIRPNRLARSKLGLSDLVSHLRGDRIGLIPFAGDSYLYCPLTADYSAFMMLLEDVYPGIISRGGTAIEQALRRAANSFDDHLMADRVILLITDGEDTAGDPLAVLDELRQRNIRLFAVGVGSPEGDLIPVTDERGGTAFLRDRQGNIVRTRLQEEALERLAARTGGIYVRATPADFGLDYLYEQGIAPLQRDLLETEEIRAYEDRFAWFVGAALLLLLIEAAIRDRPTRALRAAATGKTAVGMCLVFLCGTIAHAASPRHAMEEGLRAYEEQQYEAAADAFRQAADQAGETNLDPSRARFNRANALYRQERFPEAAQAYEEALRSADLDVQHRAYFNRGNALLNAAQQQAGQQQLEEAKTQTEQALDAYRNALTLKPDDRGAKVNYELAERFREELEMQLAQQPPQPDPSSEEQDEQQDQEESGEDDQESSTEPDPQDQEQPAPDEGEEEEESGEEEPSQDQPPPPDGAEQEPSESPAPQPDSMEEMTEEEAMLLLNALRDEEQETRDQMRLRLGEPGEAIKDW